MCVSFPSFRTFDPSLGLTLTLTLILTLNLTLSVLVSMLENPSSNVSAAALHAMNVFLCDVPSMLTIRFLNSDRKIGEFCRCDLLLSMFV